MKKNSTLMNFRMKEQYVKMLNTLADEKKISKTAVMESAVSMLYNQDVTDENILLARMNVLEQKVEFVSKKSETFFRLMYFALPAILARVPPLPKAKDEAQLALDNGARTWQRIVMLFRNDEAEHDIGFLQSVYGDMQESLKEGYAKERHK